MPKDHRPPHPAPAGASAVKARLPSIRQRLAMLVCACVLPAAAVSALLIYDHYQVERALLLGEALSTARSMVAVVDRDFDTVTTALRTLSASDAIDTDLGAFKRQALSVHHILPISDISLVARDDGRQLMNTSAGAGLPLPPPGDATLARRVLAQGQPAVSDLFQPGDGAAPFITVGVPVYRNGMVASALTARMPPQSLATILTDQKLPATWRVTISDSSGIIVARSNMSANLLGKAVNPALRDHLRHSAEGRFEALTQEGQPAVLIYSRSPKSGWTVTLGVPQHTLSAGLSRTLQSLILATVVLLTLGLALAWRVGGRIAASIHALIEPATALGLGAAVAMPQVDFREAAQVAASLVHAATALQQARAAASDETAQRQSAQAALVAADTRKDEFLATLAHELRNPMAPLVNAVEILRMGDERRATPKNVLDIMERQLRQMVRLIDDLLDVSRITTNKLSIKNEALTLQEVIAYAQETVGSFIDKRGHHLLVNLPAEALSLRGDATRLSQVFSNLLNNAAKYTQPGGTIRLDAERQGGRVLVRISDTGIGIPAAVLPHIFEIFFQADHTLGRAQSGLGIGLPLARRLVELHGGSISVSSAGAGLGSTVSVDLPIHGNGAAAPAAAPAGENGAGLAAATLPSHRVLLADDNVDNANTLRTLLTGCGQQVHVSYDGMGALLAAESFHPQFAFLDIGMPGLDGYQLAQRLRQEPATRACVLVAVTGWGQEKDQQRARDAGFDFHIVKPVRLDQLRDILARKAPLPR